MRYPSRNLFEPMTLPGEVESFVQAWQALLQEQGDRPFWWRNYAEVYDPHWKDKKEKEL